MSIGIRQPGTSEHATDRPLFPSIAFALEGKCVCMAWYIGSNVCSSAGLQQTAEDITDAMTGSTGTRHSS